MSVCEKEKCTGCFACYNICPQHAIEMIEDEYGFIYPEINKQKCTDCGLCTKICPSINQVRTQKPTKSFAMWNKDETIREKSTSGAAATTFYSYILLQGGVGYGCDNIKDGRVAFTRIENLNQLENIKGSKYVHAYIEDAYQNVKKDLKDGKRVLFIGTPCQIAGLKSYLQKENDNLITVDIICHGVPSQRFLKEEIESKIGNEKFDKITFRDENGWNFKIMEGNKIVYQQVAQENYYIKLFLSGLCYRDNCYQCQYANSARVSDITIGDFWGIQGDEFKNEKEKGISVILPITSKGEKFIEEVKANTDIFLQEKSAEEAIHGNAQLNRPSRKHKKHKKFKKLYKKKGYYKATRKYLKREVQLYKLKRMIKNNHTIYALYQKIKKRK